MFSMISESEWEYVARAGDERDADFRTHKIVNSDMDENHCLKNAWGLQDIQEGGEWCSSWFTPYPDSEVIDPIDAKSGKFKCCRAECNCGWFRYTVRSFIDPHDISAFRGFRIILKETADACPETTDSFMN